MCCTILVVLKPVTSSSVADICEQIKVIPHINSGFILGCSGQAIAALISLIKYDAVSLSPKMQLAGFISPIEILKWQLEVFCISALFPLLPFLAKEAR